MYFYIIAAGMFWILAASALCAPKRAIYLHTAAFLLFVAIAGLRYQTGYDWLVYENYIHGVNDPSLCYMGPPMEPLFWLLSALAGITPDATQTLFFLTACFNGIALYLFCRRFAAPFAFVAAIYFCWIYLPLQMAMVRQSIAISFVMLALIALRGAQAKKAAAWTVAALGFQVSAVLFLPLLWQRPWHWVWKHLNIILALLLVFAACVPSPSKLLLNYIAQADLFYISDKLTSYLSPASFVSRSASQIGYLIFNAGFLWMARNKMRLEEDDRFLLYPLILMIVPEAICHDFVYIWGRVQTLAVPCQAVFVCRMFMRTNLTIQKKAVILGICFSLSGAALLYRIHRPFMEPYFPYYNVIQAHYDYTLSDIGKTRMDATYKSMIEHYATIEKNANYHPKLSSVLKTSELQPKGVSGPNCTVKTPYSIWKQWYGAIASRSS